MRYKTSMIALVLGIGIYGVAPVLNGLDPFAAPVAFAKNGGDDGGGGDHHGGHHGQGGGDDDDDDGDDGQGGNDNNDDNGNDDDDGTPDQGSGDICIMNCGG